MAETLEYLTVCRAPRLRTQFERAHAREKALDDLTSGGAFMKLAPVTAWFVRDRPKLKVVETAITVERLGICVRNGNTALRNAINKAQATLAADGTLAGLIKQWLGARRDAAGVNVKPLHVVRRDHRIVDILASPSSR